MVELQVNVDAAPLATVVGSAVSEAVGAGTTTGVTVTDTVAAALAPPGPLHVNEYVEVWVNAAVSRVPADANVPFHPPAAVQAVASVELHVKVDVPSRPTATGLAVNVAVGAAGGVTGGTGAGGGTLPFGDAPPPHALRRSSIAAVNERIGFAEG